MSANKEFQVIGQFITNVVDKPYTFFNPDKKIEDNALQIAKHFYDKVKKVEPVECSPFTELLIQDFDNDQIWEEIAAQNEPFLQYAKSTLKSLAKGPVMSKRETSESEEEASISGNSMDLDMMDQEGSSEEELNEDKEMDEFNEEEEDGELEEEEEEEEEEGLDGSELEEDFEEDKERAPKKTSEVDDEFFNLEKFNKWTEEQEELDMMSDREDDGFNFDDDLDNLEDSDEEFEDVADLNYDDFYGKQSRPKPRKLRPTEEKKVERDVNEEEGEESENDEEEEDGSVRDLFEDEEEENEQEKSAFQRQQERLAAQIEQYEEENIKDKHWTLRGEATASVRPVNSLLEEDLEFEHANKPVPVITQETTNVLEDMIKKRILDNMFDDVERKVDPTLRPFVPSKRVELNDERSKKSLAEIYEDDYSKKKLGDAAVDERDEALEKEHEEITNLFNNLCVKLDALSNFHYTPKAPKPEMEIVSNAAAISMEEVIPVNVSDATLLAPEEVYEKKRGEVKATTEMDQAERKKLRAQKKKMKRKENEMKEKEKKIMHKYNPKMAQREEKTKAVKDLLGAKNVTIIGKDGKQKTTSKAVTSASLF